MSFENIFRVQELRIDRASIRVPFEGPKRLGYFSFYCNDENERVYKQDKSSLRYLNLPDPIYINCLQGYDPSIKYDHKQPKNTNLLRWILGNETILSDYSYDFISHNGLLKDLMSLTYQADDWNLCAIKIRGKIILNKIYSYDKNGDIEYSTKPNYESIYSALNLQRLVTRNKYRSECTSAVGNDSFFGVFHSKIGFHRIIHAGYLDCVANEQELDKPFDDMKFVLIKKFNAPRDSPSFHHANTWWSLATLAGVDTVICAKCEPDFTVKNIDKINVDNIINRQRQMILLASLSSILDYLSLIVQDENKCYNFTLSVKHQKILGYRKMALNETMIPSWYIDAKLPSESQ